MVYELSETDEDRLDKSENVPVAYVKETHPISFTPKAGVIGTTSGTSDSLSTTKINALIYIDHKRVIPSVPKEEYIHRINMGIKDAVREGIPEEYFETYFRPFIPAESAPADVVDPFAPETMVQTSTAIEA